MSRRERYIIELEDMGHESPASRRLADGLSFLKRRLRLKCLDFREVGTPTVAADHAGGIQAAAPSPANSVVSAAKEGATHE